MTWNQVFPLGTTQISQSVTPFQQNWAFLAANIGTDHFFNTGVPNEGHHQFVQLLDQGPIALAAGMSGVLYSQATGSANMEQPYWTNAVGVRQIPTAITGTVAVASGPTTQLMVSLTGLPRSMGLISAQDPNNATSFGLGFYFRDSSPLLNIINISAGGNITGFSPLTNNGIYITTKYNGNAVYQVYTMPY